jgi:hypothetical protein
MARRIPDEEIGQIEFGANIDRCNGIYADMLGLNAAEVAALETLRVNFETLHQQCADRNQPKTVTAAKNAAKKAYIKELRRFIKELQGNPKMTDTVRADYNITVRKTPSKVGKPHGEVFLTLTYEGGPHRVIVKIEAMRTTDEGDARANYGVAIYRGLMPPGGATVEQAASAKHYLMKPPVSGDELLYYRFTRNKKEIAVFDAEEAGMTAYFCARFENQKGEAGEWGPIVCIVSP